MKNNINTCSVAFEDVIIKTRIVAVPTWELVMNKNIKIVLDSFEEFGKNYMGLQFCDGFKNSITIVEKTGKGLIKLFWYDTDDTKTIYFESLGVNTGYRMMGLGYQLISIAERLAEKLNFETINLIVEEDSWMQKWFERRNYVISQSMENPNFVRMSKLLVVPEKQD